MADSFHNVRLSDRVEADAQGGPGFKTTVTETASGDEFRNVEWSRTRGKWTISYTHEHWRNQEIIAFFYARRGRAYGFRFRDWSDYKVDNVFAKGDGIVTEFQAAKIYEPGQYAFSRRLSRLVAPVVITVNGTPVTTGVVADLNTGKVSFSIAPADGDEIGITCEFDVPVRFDDDELPASMITQDISSMESIPIIEIRDKA